MVPLVGCGRSMPERDLVWAFMQWCEDLRIGFAARRVEFATANSLDRQFAQHLATLSVEQLQTVGALCAQTIIEMQERVLQDLTREASTSMRSYSSASERVRCRSSDEMTVLSTCVNAQEGPGARKVRTRRV